MLTDKQEKYVLGLIEGKSQREAYRAAYDASHMKDETVDKRACELLKNGKVAERFKELQAKARAPAEEAAIATAQEVLAELTAIGMGTKTFPSYDMFGNERQHWPSMTARLKALEQLGRSLGLYTDKLDISGAVPVVISGEDELKE